MNEPTAAAMASLGVDDKFLQEMQRHKNQEMELLQKIAMRTGNSPSFPLTSSSPPVGIGSSPYAPVSPISSPGYYKFSSLDRALFNDPTYQQPNKKQRTNNGARDIHTYVIILSYLGYTLYLFHD